MESGDSLDDISFNISKDPGTHDSDEIDLSNKSDSEDRVPLATMKNQTNFSHLKEGEFVVVLFPGKKATQICLCN